MSKATPPEVPVRFYRSDTGREPVREWLRELEEGDRRAIGLESDAGDRLLDPGNGAVTLQTLSRAANAVGRGLRIELV